MKKFLYLILLAILSVGIFVSCKNEDAKWIFSFNEGMKIAQQKDKALFVNFHSKTDEITEELNQNAFQNPEFLEKYSKDFIFVSLDYTDVLKAEKLDSNTTEEERINAQKILEESKNIIEIANKYAVRELPISLVISKEGYVICNIKFYDLKEDFNSNSPNAEKAPLSDIITIYDYSKICEKFNEATLASLEFKQNLKIANGNGKIEDRVMAIDEIYDNTDFVYRYLLKDLNQKVIEIDSENKTGSYPKHFIAKKNVEAIELGKDYKAICDNFLKATEDKNLSPEDKQLMFFLAGSNIAQLGTDFYDEAKNLYQKSIDASPKSENVTFLKKAIKIIDSQSN